MSDDFEPVTSDLEPELDRWNRYKLPDPYVNGAKVAWTRATTLAGTLTDKFGVNEWRNRKIVEGLAQRADLYALACGADPDDKQTMQRIADDAMEAAKVMAGANVGTALHSFTQRANSGTQRVVPGEWTGHLDAYRAELDRQRMTVIPEYMERICVCTDVGVAGKFDNIVAIDNQLYIADLKTAKLESVQYAWLENSIQLACYANASHIWDIKSQSYIPMPPVDQKTAFVIHLPNDVRPAQCVVYEIDIQSGWKYAQMAHDVRAARTRTKYLSRPRQAPPAPATDLRSGHHKPGSTEVDQLGPFGVPVVDDPAEKLLMHAVQNAGSVSELKRLWSEGVAAGTWTEAHLEAGKTRQVELAAQADKAAREALDAS